MSVCSVVQSFTSPLLLLLLLLSSSSVGAVPSPFQLAPDTPAPAEPTPTQATPRPDPCEGRPCLNGGLCLALPSAGRPEDTWEYTCTCSQGFTGRNCECWFASPVLCMRHNTDGPAREKERRSKKEIGEEEKKDGVL
eukprot:superscaffoldBa00001961_g12666